MVLRSTSIRPFLPAQSAGVHDALLIYLDLPDSQSQNGLRLAVETLADRAASMGFLQAQVRDLLATIWIEVGAGAAAEESPERERLLRWAIAVASGDRRRSDPAIEREERRDA
jgi:hypothetical protein